jgi:peptidoglycan/LPS O-acetylase OafA/YrhL
MKDSPNLDLLRSCAVGFVLLSHFGYAWQEAVPAYNFRVLGSLGVAIFFVHTTLVLMMSLERHGAATVPFLVRRFFRIYPLSVTVVLLFALVGPSDSAQVVSNLLLVQNISGHASTPSPLWSLPYEVQMYLVLPAVYAVTRTAQPVLWTVRLCAAGVLLGLAAALWSPFRPLTFVPCFLPGVLAFVMGRHHQARLSPLVLFAVIGAAAVAVPMLAARGVPGLPMYWALCLLLGLTIPMCRQITLAPLAKAGKVVATYSYGIYLTHAAAMSIAFNVLRGFPLAVQLAGLLVMLAVLPWLAYHCIEKPGIRLGVRLADNSRATGFLSAQRKNPPDPKAEGIESRVRAGQETASGC